MLHITTENTRASKFNTRINKKFTLPSPYLTERPFREANAIKLIFRQFRRTYLIRKL